MYDIICIELIRTLPPPAKLEIVILDVFIKDIFKTLIPHPTNIYKTFDLINYVICYYI